MIRRAGVLFLWICLLFLAKWTLGHGNTTGEQGSVVFMLAVISLVGLILCLPLLLVERYRTGRFMAYSALSLLIGGLVANSWWLGQAAGLASLFLSIPALIGEDLMHTRLFGKRPGHGIWLILVLHCAMLLPLNPMVRNLLELDLEDALFLGVLFPVTIWRCVATMLRVTNGGYHWAD